MNILDQWKSFVPLSCVFLPIFPSSLPLILLEVIIPKGVQHQLPGILSGVVGVTLGPVVSDGVGEEAALPVEGRSGDGAFGLGEVLQTRVADKVPENEGAVRADGREDVVLDRVEVEVVDRPDLDGFVGIPLVSVAAEGEVELPILCLSRQPAGLSKTLRGVYTYKGT